MTDLAPNHFTVAHDAFDPRADGRRRSVHMSMTLVTIERVLRGIRMAVAVPVSTYRAVTVRVSAPSGAATVTLSHARDRELDVVLASGHADDVAIAAKAWSTVLDKTIAVEAGVSILPAQPRSAKPAKPPRARTAGDTRRLLTRFAGEREIIART